jgi:hypothetical protein
MKKRFGKNQGVCDSLNAYRIGLGKKMNLVENHASCKKNLIQRVEFDSLSK